MGKGLGRGGGVGGRRGGIKKLTFKECQGTGKLEVD